MPKSFRTLGAGLFAALLLAPAAAHANQEIAKAYLDEPRKVGDGVLTYLFWDVYRATLYAPQPGWRSDAPFVLTLDYLRDLKGADIAERTIQEIRDQGYQDEARLSAWQESLMSIFPDVNEGDSLTAVRSEDGTTFFYRGASRIGAIADPQFADKFFDIWLGEKTSAPKLRRALLGG